MTMGASTSISMLTYGTRTLSSVSSTGNMNTSRHRNMSKNMLHVLSISASVTRIRWRPVANETTADGDDRHDAMIAVATAQIKGASAGGAGLLSLWSHHRPYMPLSVVEGHQEGAVVDFDWLDTPKSRDARLVVTDAALTSRIPGVSSHEVDSILYDSSGIERNENAPCRFWQHVISVGRDGNCIVQSLVRGNSIPMDTFACFVGV
jgi:WD repeat-containing protein 24